MASLISIGVSGLIANQMALGTTGNNITNANVAGYSRQRVDQVTSPEQYSGVGYIGSGVQVTGVRRIVEQFVIEQLQLNTANFNDVAAQSTLADQIDSLLADQSTGIAPMLQSLFADIQQASQDPASIPGRQVVLNDAESLVDRFNALYSQLTGINSTINNRLDSLTSEATSLAQVIAQLNQNIVDSTGSGLGSQPNALLDKREEAIRQLSELVGVRAVAQSNGMVNIFVGNGQPLVVGAQANALGTAASTTDATRREVVFVAPNGSSQPITQFVTGGTVGGLLKFRQNTLDTSQNSLGQIALSVADKVNQQHRLGLDLNGDFGSNLFTDINTSAQMQARALPRSSNTSTAVLEVYIGDTSALKTNDYQLRFTSATDYSLVRADGSALTPPLSGTIGALPAAITTPDGFEIRIPSGSTFAAGDMFAIQPTKLGAQSISVSLQSASELALALPVSTSASLRNTGGGAISAGEMISVYQADGVTMQSAFATPGQLSPPILVRFTSATTYDILDNSNPASPSMLQAGLTFIPGQSNAVTINGDNLVAGTASGSAGGGAPATLDYGTGNETFTVDFNGSGVQNITLATDYTAAGGFADLIADVQSQLDTQFGPGVLIAQDGGTGNLEIVEAGPTFTGSTISIGGSGEAAVFGGSATENAGAVTVPGDPIYTFNISGNPSSGDEFSIAYNANGSSDNRNALALGGLQRADTIGRGSFEDAYGQLVADVGTRAAQLQISRDAGESLLTQAQATRDAISGVNLDEEAANLIMFQQAYNASAQIIQVARSLFDTLLAAFR